MGNILLAEHISKSYGDKLLFEDITLGIDEGQKIALVAANGTGKTSFLDIIAGSVEPDTGTVSLREGTKVGYLSQNPDLNDKNTIFEELFHSDNPFIKAIRNYELSIKYLEQKDNTDNRKFMQDAMNRMDAMQAWDYEEKVKEILSRLKLGDIHQPVSILSGGQRKKVALARVLMQQVDLMILDEPTNHLDIEMIEWLENFLSRQKLALLLVTHDRYFLDELCEEIVEMYNNQLYKYKGNYSYFLEKREELHQQMLREIDKAKNLYRKELEWMRRMPKARGTKAQARVEAFYSLEQKANQQVDDSRSQLFVKSERLGKKILEINDIYKSFGNLKIVEAFSYTFKRGEKIGVVGPNGIGKSTLFNMIVGDEKPDKGSIVHGQTTKISYFSQQGMQVEGNKRVLEIVKDVAEEIELHNGTMSASRFLSYFNFDSTTQYNYFNNLSGGEKRRLYLLMKLMENPNFLILDEPTNDLDIPTLAILEDFLRNFNGCVLISSHDRAFLDNLVDHVFVFEGHGHVKDFPGNYTQYRLKTQKEEKQKQIQKPKKQQNKRKPGKRDPNKASYKQKQRHAHLEQEIQKLEDEKDKLTQKMNSGELAPQQLQENSEKIGELMEKIDELTSEWMELEEIVNPE
ncbi:MAG: ABC-F family ATP-binding cassette domain-containing protein [Bacteroidales bacterium]|nr:ABC-F family ATP-binding cassette domain-containing protein [Bacteroidales bacterium]MCF8327052.1 ABC-F family ATP-binding cassette domain-containing protein [Bacteroidales bacterium]